MFGCCLRLPLADLHQATRFRVDLVKAVHVEIVCFHMMELQLVDVEGLAPVGVLLGMLCRKLDESSAIRELRAGLYLVIMPMHYVPRGWLIEQHDGGWASLTGGFHGGLLLEKENELRGIAEAVVAKQTPGDLATRGGGDAHERARLGDPSIHERRDEGGGFRLVVALVDGTQQR